MKVIHLCNLPLPAEHPDCGRISFHPGRWVLNLALAQRAHTGIDARLVMQVPGASRDFHTEIEGVPVHFIAAPDRMRSATFFVPDVLRISRHVRQQNPDLVHAHGTEDAYALAAESCGKPSIITAQGCFFIINRELPPRLLSRERVVQLTEWLALKRAKHVIAKSDYVRGELAAKFPHLTLTEIPNTFDPRLLEIPIDGPRGDFDLAFVGTIVERKGVHVLAQALSILRDTAPEAFNAIKLNVFGDRPGEESPYERSMKIELRQLLGPRAIFHGTIPALDVARKLSHVKILVAPSLEEMFGNQLIEALLVGADAIVSEGTAMAENARKLGGGSVVPIADAESLAEAIRIHGSLPPDLAQKEKIRRTIIETMGPEFVARRHRAVYEQVMASC